MQESTGGHAVSQTSLKQALMHLLHQLASHSRVLGLMHVSALLELKGRCSLFWINHRHMAGPSGCAHRMKHPG